MIRTMLSPQMLTALVLGAVILAVAGTLSLRGQRRALPVVADARRARRTERTEDRVIAIATRVLVLAVVAVALMLLR
jgi:hypothetical protein